MNKLYFIFIFFTASNFISADSKKMIELVYFKQLYMAVKIFSHEEGHKPQSWRELVEGGFLNRETIAAASEKISFQSRYGFLSEDNYFDGVYPPEKILLMAINKGNEGNITQSDGKIKEGRWLIVESENHGIHTRWHSEEELEQIFRKAGLDLADYTGINGKWVNKQEILEVEKSGGYIDSVQKNDSSNNTGNNNFPNEIAREVVRNSRSESNIKPFKWKLIIISALLGLGVLTVLRRVVFSKADHGNS